MGRTEAVKKAPRNERLQKFVVEYVKTLNAVESAKRAGYSVTYANKKAHLLVQELADPISELMAKAAKRAELDASVVLREIDAIARANVQDYWVEEEIKEVEEGEEVKTRLRPKKLFELTREQAAAIKVYSPDGRHEFWSKNTALLHAAQALGMMNQRIQISARHEHTMRRDDFSNVPTQELIQMLTRLRSFEKSIVATQESET